MNGNARQYGFSLTETLLAVGTLAIGMMFIAGTFLTGVYFATVSTERTIGAVAAEEAFAKVRLYALDPNNANLPSEGFVPYEQLTAIPAGEFLYPSLSLVVPAGTPGADPTSLSSLKSEQRQYSWAALCRRMDADSPLIQCTVFVSREANPASSYWMRQSGGLALVPSELPRPVRVTVAWDAASLTLPEVLLQDAVPTDAIDELAFVNDGSVLVDDKTGQVYRVLERGAAQPDRLRLDRLWVGVVPGSSGSAWVVPPAISGGRNPVVGVYQKVLRFPGG
jgi:Tfp pilus assembly protein PilV